MEDGNLSSRCFSEVRRPNDPLSRARSRHYRDAPSSVSATTSPRPLDRCAPVQAMIEKLSADVRATHMTQSYFDHVAAVEIGRASCRERV